MIPFSTKPLPVQFVEGPGNPVFWIVPASVTERAHFEAELSAAGAGEVYHFFEAAAIRDDLTEILEGDEMLPAALESVGRYFDGEADAADTAAVESIFATLRNLPLKYAKLARQKALREELTPLFACRHFLAGWDGLKDGNGELVPFEKNMGRVSDETLARLDRIVMKMVSFKILDIIHLSPDEIKNWKAPLLSQADPETSIADSVTKSSEKAGKSAAPTSKKTRNS